ncbi:MAG: hypothetical protein GY898_05720 [Proteobacteria bacterium]|nr:hypothetical protein [Pseudomonadota bacterium]
MKVLHDEAWNAFTSAEIGGTRIKKVRAEPLTPGGRCRLTLFELVDGEGRPHPRLTTAMPLPEDPSPPTFEWTSPGSEEFEEALTQALEANRAVLDGNDLELPEASPAFFRNAIVRQRRAALFAQVAASLPEGAEYAFRAQQDLAYAGAVGYDDADTGTYPTRSNATPRSSTTSSPSSKPSPRRPPRRSPTTRASSRPSRATTA